MKQAIAPPPAPNTKWELLNANTQEQICELLDWSADQYSEYLYNAGINYLKCYMPAFNDGIADKFEKSRVYWNWYKRMHMRIDEEILSYGFVTLLNDIETASGIKESGLYHFSDLDVEIKHMVYTNLHQAEKKVKEWKPNRVVWKEVMK